MPKIVEYDCSTIGGRTCHAIQQRAKEKGCAMGEEMDRMYMNRNCFKWWSRGRSPSAFFLQQLALNDYDVYWILTGRRSQDSKSQNARVE